MTNKRVHFSVTGEFITNKVRDLWQEREFAKAFDVLDCCIGITKDQQIAVIDGRSKLVGVNDVELVDDDWQRPDGYCSFNQALQQGKHWPELERKRQDAAYDLLSKAADCLSKWTNGDEMSDVQVFINAASREIGHEAAMELFTQIKQHRINDRGDFTHKTLAQAHRDFSLKMLGLDAGVALPSFEVIMDRGYTTTPKRYNDMSSESGWLLPDGKYYGCSSMEHIGIATQLLETQYPNGDDRVGGFESLAEDLGWIKISKAMLGLIIAGNKPPTSKQLTKLQQYVMFHGKDFDTITASLDIQ